MGRRSRSCLYVVALFLALFASPLIQPACAAPNDILLYKGSDRTQRLIAGARQEGQLVLYSTMIVNQAIRPLVAAFEKKYPFIAVSYWRGDVEAALLKVNVEIRSGHGLADVVEGSLGGLAVKEGDALPFYSPQIDRLPARYRDPENNWAPTRLNYFSAAFNTKLLTRDAAPKTYQDLLDPKWAGKIAWRPDDTGALLFISSLRHAWGDAKALPYLKALARQKIIDFGAGSARTLVDRVMQGEYPLALNIFAHHPLISKAEGAPVDSLLLDPMPSIASQILISKGVRHPNAALLFVDFMLSREGQEILAQAEYFPVRPDAPPLPRIAAVVPARAGVSENYMSPSEQFRLAPSSEKIFDDLFR
jgi:iron(III) transport system substrate-binding protein